MTTQKKTKYTMPPEIKKTHKGHGRGRTKYQPAMCKTAKLLLADGGSKKSTAAALGICKTTFYDYVDLHPEFKKAVEEGEALSYKYWEDMGKSLAKSGNAGTWALIMANRFGWRAKNEVTGEDGGPLKIEIVEVGE